MHLSSDEVERLGRKFRDSVGPGGAAERIRVAAALVEGTPTESASNAVRCFALLHVRGGEDAVAAAGLMRLLRRFAEGDAGSRPRDEDVLPARDFAGHGITDADRKAAEAATGYGPDILDDDRIAACVAEHVDETVPAMKANLKALVRKFEDFGGRGVHLADAIDSLRVAIAVRKVRRRIKA